MNKLNRIIFLGSPDFAVPSLRRLLESEIFRPVAVITQPDRPAGRKLQLMPTPVKKLALLEHLPVLQPEDINSPASVEHIRSFHPDLLVTVAYGCKLKKAVRELAPFGAVNLHPSLLPALRGAAPIPSALWQGMNTTGITIFRLENRMDAGPIYRQKSFYIFPDEHATDLSERLAHQGARELLHFLEDFSAQPWEPTPQDENLATYCRKLDRDDCRLDWDKPAAGLLCQIRALAGVPGAFSLFREQPLKILEAEVLSGASGQAPGCIASLDKNVGFTVQTGDGQLLVKTVQPSGKKPMSAWAFHLGAHLTPGEGFTHD